MLGTLGTLTDFWFEFWFTTFSFGFGLSFGFKIGCPRLPGVDRKSAGWLDGHRPVRAQTEQERTQTMGPNSLAKCERKDECARDAVGTVRTSMNPPGGDVQTCELHAGGLVIWRFGRPSPYKTSNPPVGQQRRSGV